MEDIGRKKLERWIARGYVVLCDDEAHKEIVEYLWARGYLVYVKSASIACSRLMIEEVPC